VEYPDAVYHVTARGNEKKAIYRDDRDRERFLAALGETVERFGVVVHAYCLMPNHYHLLLQTPRANLSTAAGWTTYSIRFNRRHRRSGHLFQGRYKAHLVDADSYAEELIKYIHLNPVRPKDKRRPIPTGRKRELMDYQWSSHRAYAGYIENSSPSWLSLDWLSYYGSTRETAQREYCRQIEQMFGQIVNSPWEDLQQGLVLGGEALSARVREVLSKAEGQEEIRWQQRADAACVTETIAAMVEKETDKKIAMWLRVRLGGERMTQVAAEYGYRDGSGVHQVIRRLEQKAAKDQVLSAYLQALVEEARRCQV